MIKKLISKLRGKLKKKRMPLARQIEVDTKTLALLHPLKPSTPVTYRNQRGLRVAGLIIDATGADVGICIINCPGAVIEYNQVSGGRTCIQVEDSPGVSVAQNILSGYRNIKTAKGIDPGHAIQFRSSSGTITANKIDRRDPKTKDDGPGEDGINIFGKSSATVSFNTITGAGRPAGNPITIDKGATRVHVQHNTLRAAGPRGVVFAWGERHTCTDNLFDGGCTDAAVAVDRHCYKAAPIEVSIERSMLNRIKGSGQVWVNPDGTEAKRL